MPRTLTNLSFRLIGGEHVAAFGRIRPIQTPRPGGNPKAIEGVSLFFSEDDGLKESFPSEINDVRDQNTGPNYKEYHWQHMPWRDVTRPAKWRTPPNYIRPLVILAVAVPPLEQSHHRTMGIEDGVKQSAVDQNPYDA